MYKTKKGDEVTSMDPLDTIIDQILNEKNIASMDAEVRTQLAADLKERLLDQINRAVIDALPAEKVTELNALLDAGDPVTDQQLQQLVQDSGLDVQRITTETILRFRDLYIRPSSQDSEDVRN